MDWNVTFTPTYPGWIPPDERDTDTQKAHERFVNETPTVDEVFTGSANSGADRPRVWEVAKAGIERGLIPQEWVRNGSFLKNISQLIGSCVGFAAGNLDLYSSVIDAMIRGQAEKIMVPFVPYHYGCGRLHSGIRGSGSGSTGSGQAKALQQDGVLAFDHPNVPKPTFGDAIVWTESIETKWSDGARIGDEFVAEGKKHTYPNVARVTSADQAATLLDSFYTITIASNWGGLMRCPIKDGVLLNRRAGTWNHQMSVLDYMIHATLGRLFYVLNQWRYPHGVCPTGAPEGGFWILESDFVSIIRQEETFAFADKIGFVDRSRAFDWLVVW